MLTEAQHHDYRINKRLTEISVEFNLTSNGYRKREYLPKEYNI